MNTETQKTLPKNNHCPKCELLNQTLHWLETAQGFLCPGCAHNRQAEQQRLDAKFRKLPIIQESFDNRIIKNPKSSQ
jgi:predicted RNA-binding Zn-ribbon protein involved in translation (DUF1610 family)